MEGEIAKATAALVTALEHGSAHSAGELYADDATLLAPGCEPIRGRTSIEAYWATGIRLELSALAFERHVLKALGGQAVDAGRYTISIVSDAAGPVAEHGTYLRGGHDEPDHPAPPAQRPGSPPRPPGAAPRSPPRAAPERPRARRIGWRRAAGRGGHRGRPARQFSAGIGDAGTAIGAHRRPDGGRPGG